MKKVIMLLVMTCLSFSWIPSDAQAFQIVTRTMMQEEQVTETDLIRTVDNFIVLFDTSSSTNKMVPGRNISKIQAAKQLLKERVQWLPDLGYNAGLYIYTSFEMGSDTFKEIYGVQKFDRARYAAAIDQLPEKGRGPAVLQAGLRGLRKTMAGLTGKTAIIMFTDGIVSNATGVKKPLQIVQEIARDHDVSFYLISSAKANAEKQLLAAVSKINASSRVIPMTAFLDKPAYLSGALFTVKTTSYTRLKPVTQVVGFLADIFFGFDSFAIESDFAEKLDLLGQYLQNNPDAYVVAAGFSDNTGDAEYNLMLSERRSESVKAYLVDNFGIDMSRIVKLWFGELNPWGDNQTKEGRQLNRRVGIAVGGVN